MHEQHPSAAAPAHLTTAREKASWQTPRIAIVDIAKITRFDITALDDGLGGFGGVS